MVDTLYYVAYWVAGAIGVLKSNDMMVKRKWYFLRMRPTAWGWAFIVLIFLAFRLSFVRDNIAKEDNARLNASNIKQIREQQKQDAEVFRKALLAMQKQNAIDQRENTNSMIETFGKFSTSNIQEHLKTQQKEDLTQNKIDSTQKKIDKIDTTKNKEAFVRLYASNKVLKITMKGDSLKMDCIVYNYGDRIAYSLSTDLRLVYVIGDRYFKSDPFENGGQLLPDDLPNPVLRTVTFIFPFSRSLYNNSSAIYCIASGSYYLDSNFKKPKTFEYITGINPKNGEFLGNNLTISIGKLWSGATQIRNP